MNQGIPVNQVNSQLGQQQSPATQMANGGARQQAPGAGGVAAQGQGAQGPQRQLTQQQLQRQRHQILFQRLKNYKFAETSEDILKKYSTFPASLEFHIYDNHFKFGQQDGVIPKNSPLGKEFLKYILREEIPDSLVEVIKDVGIQLYEGSVILNVVDHCNVMEKMVKLENGESKLIKAPKNYRTVLRPVQLSIYADLLYQTDSAQLRLSDQSTLLLELEILTLTKRNLNLSIPLNPLSCNDYLRPEYNNTRYDPDQDRVLHTHRVNDEMYKYRPLHEDTITHHHNQSEYEQMMSLLSENSSSNSANVMGDSTTLKSSQFVRLRFIENYRRKLERMKLAGTNLQNKIAAQDFNNTTNNNTNNGVSNLLGLTPQQRLLIQQQRMIQQQQKLQMSNALNNERSNSNSNSSQTNLQQLNDKKKLLPKRPRKQQTKKGSVLTPGINDSNVSTPESGEPLVKKKRGTYKKKNKNNEDSLQQQAPSNIMDMNFNMMGGFPQ